MTALAMTTGLLAGCGGSDGKTESAATDAAGTETAADAAKTEDDAAKDDAADADTEEKDAAASSAAGTGEAVTIWYYWETEGHQVALDQVIQDYNGSQDQYEVTAKYVPFADFKKQLVSFSIL